MLSLLALTLGVSLSASLGATLVPVRFQPDPALDTVLREAVDAIALERNESKLKDEVEIAAATVDRPNRLLTVGVYRAEGPMYPCSVVKMFYMAYAYSLVSSGKLRITDEVRRAMTDMIVDSSNDGTGLIMDEVTGTTGGPELPPDQLAKWMEKRQAVNRYFKSLGFTGVNACQKTWNEGPYGREKQGYGPNNERRNSLTPNACLRLMGDIMLDGIVGPKECEAMRALLSRKIPAEFAPDDSAGADEQARDFIGRILPKGSSLWSKAGWVSNERHDVAFIRTPNGKEFVLAIFTEHHPDDHNLIGQIAQQILTHLGGL